MGPTQDAVIDYTVLHRETREVITAEFDLRDPTLLLEEVGNGWLYAMGITQAEPVWAPMAIDEGQVEFIRTVCDDVVYSVEIKSFFKGEFNVSIVEIEVRRHIGYP